jgi:hypothetical protein
LADVTHHPALAHQFDSLAHRAPCTLRSGEEITYNAETAESAEKQLDLFLRVLRVLR